MAGETEDKVFFIVKGRINSGKGLLTLLISKAFFNKFGNINATNFCQKRTDGDMAKMDSWKCQTRHKRIGVANEAPKKGLQRRRHQEGPRWGPSHGETNGVDEMTFFMETTFWLFVNDMSSIEDCDEATAERLRVIPTAYKYLLLDDKYEAEKDKRMRREGGPHHQVGVDQAPRGDPGVRTVGVRGVRDHAARGARGHPRDQRQVPGGRQRGREDRPSSTPPIRTSTCGEGLQRGREARGHQHELGEPQREVGDWGYKKQQKKISGRNQYVIHGMRLVVERPEY